MLFCVESHGYCGQVFEACDFFRCLCRPFLASTTTVINCDEFRQRLIVRLMTQVPAKYIQTAMTAKAIRGLILTSRHNFRAVFSNTVFASFPVLAERGLGPNLTSVLITDYTVDHCSSMQACRKVAINIYCFMAIINFLFEVFTELL